ncbi:MAG: HesA/MoeB/ThiF family protein [Flavobacteriaceae bacterium]|nr:HesA/MoeB/ThiF family protein [Flavobacteriaceae bacterium]
MNRYSRHIVLEEVGPQGQAKLSTAKVLVVGAGGLGCPILQYLAAVGIGTLGIIDFDVVELSNLQRQILFGTSNIGMNKALAAKNRLEDLNPSIQIHAYPEKLTTKNALSLFECYDIIVDGSDNFATRYLVNDASIITHKPVVFGAIYKFEGQVSVFNYNDGPTYRCLFPKPPKEGSIANCSEVGVIGVLPGIIGSMQANEVIKMILGFDHVLSGKLLCYDAKTTQTTTIKIAKSKTEIDNVRTLKDQYPETLCETNVQEISAEKALNKENATFIDVRERGEFPKIEVPPNLQIPLRTLEENLNRFHANKEYIIFCQSGIRSKVAVKLLQEMDIPNCFSLQGGALAITTQLKTKT